MDRLLSKKQVIERISISLTQLDRWTWEPEYAHLGCPKPIKVGGRVFYLERKIDSFIASLIAKGEASE